MKTYQIISVLLLTTATLFFQCRVLAGGEVARPKPFVATYEAKYSGIGITATRSLQSDNGNSQQLRFHAKSWLAQIEEISQFHWDNNGHIIPSKYSYARTGLGKNRYAVLNFNWDTKTVINNVQNKPWTMDVPELALDKLSYQLQLRNDLLNQKNQMSYQIADGGRLKTYQFNLIGDEVLHTKAGKLNTVKIERVRENNNRVTYLWFAKDWDYLVVQIQQQEDDQDYQINLSSAELDGIPVKGF